MSQLPEALRRGPLKARQAQQQVHGRGLAGRINTWVAIRVTSHVGSMWAAYVFAVVALASLPQAIANGPSAVAAWAAQLALPLVLLPIIMVGQNVQQAHADGKAEQDHEILAALHQINTAQLEILERLDGEGR